MFQPDLMLENEDITSSLLSSSHFGSKPGTNSQEDLIKESQTKEEEYVDENNEEETPDNSLESLAHLLTANPTEMGSRPQGGIPSRAPLIITSPRDYPIASIKDHKPHEASKAVLDAFTCPPQQDDPNHIRLWESGLTLSRRVFHPP